MVKMIGCTDVTFGNSTDKMSQTGQVHPIQKRRTILRTIWRLYQLVNMTMPLNTIIQFNNKSFTGKNSSRNLLKCRTSTIVTSWLREFYNVDPLTHEKVTQTNLSIMTLLLSLRTGYSRSETLRRKRSR